MASSHTPEPWTRRIVGKKGDGSAASQHEQLCNDRGIAVFMLEHDGSDEAVANIERCMACVNACAGLDHPEGVRDLVQASASYLALIEASAKTPVPDSIFLEARAKIRQSLERIHG